jgi:hypothetical protein
MDEQLLCAIVRAVLKWIEVLDNRISLGNATKEEVHTRAVLCKIIRER